MRSKVLFPCLVTALLFLTACDIEEFGDFQRYQQDFHYSYPLSANGSISVETFNGSVEISGWDENTVDISGVKYASTQDAADALRVDINHSPGSVSIRVVRPSERRGNRGARFVIKVPRKALLDRIVTSNGAIRTLDGSGPARLRTSNGQIRVEDLLGSLDAQTSNGSIELLDIDGDARARTSNGHVRAEGVRGSLEATTSNSHVNAKVTEAGRPVHVDTSNGSIDLTLPGAAIGDVRASTSNSSITVRLPKEPDARLVANTSNSSISTDFEVRTIGSINKSHIEGTLGNGGALMDLSTSNGHIRISRL